MLGLPEYNDCKFPWNNKYRYSKLDLKKRFLSIRGVSIHQRINFNYWIEKMVGCKHEYIDISKDRGQVNFIPVDAYEDFMFLSSVRFLDVAYPHHRKRDRNLIFFGVDRCNACLEKIETTPLYSHDDSCFLCSTCAGLRDRYKNKHNDESIEGWLVYALNNSKAFKRHIGLIKG